MRPNKIFIKVTQGKDLAPKDSNGKSDPYLVILYGTQRFKTKCIKKTLNPVWTDQDFVIEADPDISQILVECWDYDKVGKHDFMGQFYINVSQIPDDGSYLRNDFALEVCSDPKDKTKNTSNVSGTIELELCQSRKKLKQVKKKKDSMNSSKDSVSSSKPVKAKKSQMQEDNNIEEFKTKVSSGQVTLGNGAKFWAYISPQNDTARYVSDWMVKFEQQDWSGSITSKDPYVNLQTPDLSGVFNVTVTAKVGVVGQPQKLKPQAGSKPDIGCGSNCAAMVGIVAAPGGGSATYWTVWDAYCQRGDE